MRRLLIAICVITLFLLIPSIKITKPFSGVSLSKVASKEPSITLSSLHNSELLKSMVVVPKTVEQSDELNQMLYSIDRIDTSILSYLRKQGVMIRLFQGQLTDEPLLYYLKWQQPRGWEKNVSWAEVPGSGGDWLVSAKIGASSPGNGHGSINLELHEIGHTVFHFLSTKGASAFTKIWDEEVDKLFPNKAYYTSYTSEYFAETFAYYYVNENHSKEFFQSAPKTFTFMQNLSESYDVFQ